jgi:hypothetical protein
MQIRRPYVPKSAEQPKLLGQPDLFPGPTGPGAFIDLE